MAVSLVSIIVPVYNGLPDLDIQLEALAAQDYAGAFEVIVSDNGSTDGLRAHLNELTIDLAVRWIDSSDTRGASHARNAGINASRGELLAFVDHDDAAHPEWLTALTRAAENYDAVGGAIEVDTLNSAEVASWRQIPRPEQRFTTVYLPYAQGGNFAMWRRVPERIGLFDETLIGGGEDVDYSWRIQQAGLTLGHAPDALMAYRLRASLRETFRQSVGYGLAAWAVLDKHKSVGCPGQNVFLAIPANLASIVWLAVARNPWLPRTLNPLPRGRWAHAVGMQYGSMLGRLRLALRSIHSPGKPNLAACQAH